MNLPEDLQQAAQEFGLALRAHATVQSYLAAQQAVLADPEAQELDERSRAMYEDLVTRQQNGEQLPPEEVKAFYALNQQARSHPLIAERDAALALVKSTFVNVGQDLSLALGIDYTALAID